MDAEVVGTAHGYACRYTPTICDGPVFRWSLENDRRRDYEVSASRNGVMVHGSSPVLGPVLLRNLIAVLALAERVSDHLDRDDRDTEFCKRIIREGL